MSRLDRFDWVRFVTWAGLMLAGVAQVIVLVCVVLWIGGCATQERQDATKQEARTLERSTETVKQAYVDGQLIELREKTVVTERELTDGATSGERRVELEPPKALNDVLKPVAKTLAGAAAGPAGEAAVDWIWQLLGGVGAMGAAGGVGAVIRERKRTRTLVRAQDEYARDIEDAETDEDVEAVKQKHQERQKALGIHTTLTRERHGV
jgi:hypothetical protein